MPEPVMISAGRPAAAGDGASLPFLMINPPLTDPTTAYHSISYLIASCDRAGYTAHRCLDANIEALNFLARPGYVAGLLDLAASVRRDSEAKSVLSRADEIRYLAALAGIGVEPDFIERAIAVFRDPERFHHYPTYQQAVLAVHRWITLLSLRSLPGTFGGLSLRPDGPVDFLSQRDMADPEVLDGVCGAFVDYIAGPFREVLQTERWRLVGLSVNFASQLPFALRMAAEIRSAVPDALIVFGGTEVCDDVKYARPGSDIWRMFPHADLIVPGEGETPLTAILDAVRTGDSFDGIDGVLTPASPRRTPRINYEFVGALPSPRYDIWEWGAYWSPEPVILYSPTRGCYWNKCTFCDYGLNTDRPTSPSRERPVDLVLADLGKISGFARTLYFSVDAMSPRYLRTLAAGLASSDLEFQWSAELRLERTFPKRGVASILKAAGCVSVAFGYESGAQRVLDLIDKGVDLAAVPGILRHLAEADIGAQMMGFTGFPSETAEEAARTFDFLDEHKDLWSLAGVGTFSLTPGSIIARRPAAFGVEVLDPPGSQDIARVLAWRDLADGTIHLPGQAPSVAPSLRAKIRRPLAGRPFVGGIDSSHTLLYFARNGRGLLPADGEDEPREVFSPEALVRIPFDDLDRFTTVADLVAERARRLAEGLPVSHCDVADWLAKPGASRRGSSRALVLGGGSCASMAVRSAGPEGRDPASDGPDMAKVLAGLRILLNPAGKVPDGVLDR